MILRARIVVPMAGPPIEDGFVSLRGEHIVGVGRWEDRGQADAGGECLDLGEAVLMPGLINAHCHLDYTDFVGQIPPPRGFTDWIQSMVAAKATWGLAEYAASWQRGAGMLMRHGTTTVADVEAVPDLVPGGWGKTPLRVHSFRELIQVRSRVPAEELVEGSVRELLPHERGRVRVGLSPHAPYTTSTELLEFAARAARRQGWRLTTHVAESEQEFEMFMYRHGPMFDWLKSQRDMSPCGLGSPVQYLERCGYLDENLVAVHVNYLWRQDAGILGRNRVSVVHCPRSHDYFRHQRFPMAELADAGVNLCLGTDSLATVRSDRQRPCELSLFAEMRALAASAPEVSCENILRMATVQGAKALGRGGELGELSVGALADLIAVPYRGEVNGVFEALVHHEGPVSAMVIGGEWVTRPGSGQETS